MDANFSTVAFQRETTWGVVPVSPALTKARLTGESLDYDKETITSEEVRDDRQTADLVKVGSSALGGLQFELSYTAFQGLFEAALFGVVSTLNLTGLSVDVTASSQLVDGSAGDFANVVVGASYRLAGLTNPASNGIKRVVAKANDGSTITLAAGSIAADQSGATISLKGSAIRNGTTRNSYTIERRIPDAGGGYQFELFTGMMLDTLNLDFEAKQIIKGELGFIGKTSTLADLSVQDPTAYTAAPTDPVMNATSNLSMLAFGGVASTEKMRKLSVQIANNLRGRDAMGEEGFFGVGVGSFKLTGSMEMYFRNNDLLEAVRNHTPVSVAFVVTDGLGNSIAFNLPKVLFAKGAANIEGKDTDVMVPIEFEAILDPVTTATFIVSYIPAT